LTAKDKETVHPARAVGSHGLKRRSPGRPTIVRD